MNIREFCQNNEIQYMPIAYYTKEGKKMVIGENNNLSVENIKEYLGQINELIKTDNKYYILKKLIKEEGYFYDAVPTYYTKAISIYLKHSKYYVIDIDDEKIKNINELNENFNCIKSTAWCEGNTKGIHIYIRCDNAPKYSNQIDVLNDYKGDFLKQNNIWEKQNKKIFNANNIININFEDLKNILNLEKINIKTENIEIMETFTNDLRNDAYNLISDIINNLDIKRAVNYVDWRNVGMALKSFNEDNYLDLFIKFSSKSNQHKDTRDFLTNINKFWTTFKSEGRIYNFFSLLKWLKTDNRKVFYEIYEKYTDIIKKEEFFKNPIDTGDYFINYVFKNIKSIVLNEKQSIIYIFNENLCIWERLESIGCLKSKITTHLKDFFKECGPFEDQNKYLQTHNINEITDYIYRMTIDQNFIDKLDTERDIINFKNGILNLKSGEFRQRTPKDYFSLYENYDYMIDKNIYAIEEIKNDFLKVCNNNLDLLNDYFTFYGYGITGHIMGENLIQIGRGANGKSTMADILHQHVLKNYVCKTSGGTFDKDNNENNKSKFTTPLCDNKYRLCFIEEIDDKKFDTAFFKMLSGSETYTGKTLYSTKETTKPIYAKYIILTNEHPNFDLKKSSANNLALNRRFATIEHKNSFISKTDKETKYKDDNKYYIRDEKMLTKYKDDIYKNSLIHLLLEYSIQFYKNNESLIYKTNIKENFIRINEDKDPIKSFLEDRTTITDKNKFIGKKGLYNDFMIYTNRKTSISFEEFFKKMKAFKNIYYIEYDGQKRADGVKGAYMGINFINTDENTDQIIDI